MKTRRMKTRRMKKRMNGWMNRMIGIGGMRRMISGMMRRMTIS